MAASQTETLRLFTALGSVSSSWAGSLLVGVGLDDMGRALALASVAAGAASLFLEPDAVRLKSAQREGCCTFTVTSLDEALRALKNEIRQGRAISVALSGDSTRCLDEMVERGVAPQCILGGEPGDPLHALTACGAHLILPSEIDGIIAEMLATCEIAEDAAASYAERRDRDERLLASIGDEWNCRWLRAAPSLFPRSLSRAFWRLRADLSSPSR